MLAYRILYQSVHAKHGEMLQLLNTLKKITPEVRRCGAAAQPQPHPAAPADERCSPSLPSLSLGRASTLGLPAGTSGWPG
jgi:hypothetical protein